MPKFFMDYSTNQDTYITPALNSIFQEVIDSIGVDHDSLTEMLQDTGYAWTVQCNLTMGSVDRANCPVRQACMAATEYLLVNFGADVSRNPLWWNTYVQRDRPPLGSVKKLD